jgi:acetate kinase
MRVLTVNTGSSSVKLRVIDHHDQVGATRESTPADLESDVADLLPHVDAVGHRIVHGGPDHVAPERVTDALVADLRGLTYLAPLHQPVALDAVEAVHRAAPDVPAVTCFDTAFHADLPPEARTYALPREWRERHGLRRYGFHGLSYAWASRRAAEMLGDAGSDDPDGLRLVVAHLGSGASLAAVRGGRSIDTTMGFTPLEGLVMATRAGTVDPGLLLWLVEHGGLSAHDVADGIDRQGGLLALAGTKDMREVLRRAAAGDADAGLAMDVYLHRLAASVAAMTAALGGFDVLVVTGGVGEAAPDVRRLLAERLGYLGVTIDPAANESVDGDTEITGPGSSVRVLVVHAREDLEIARGTREALA